MIKRMMADPKLNIIWTQARKTPLEHRRQTSQRYRSSYQTILLHAVPSTSSRSFRDRCPSPHPRGGSLCHTRFRRISLLPPLPRGNQWIHFRSPRYRLSQSCTNQSLVALTFQSLHQSRRLQSMTKIFTQNDHHTHQIDLLATLAVLVRIMKTMPLRHAAAGLP